MTLHPFSVLGFNPANGMIICAHVLARDGLHAFAEAAQQYVGGDHVFVSAHPGHLREDQDVFFPGEGLVNGATVLVQPEVFGAVSSPEEARVQAFESVDQPAAPAFNGEEGQLHIVIPKANTALARQIQSGSGVVMRQTAQGLVLDYEGDRYGAENLRTYVECLKHAAGRAVTNYPTLSRRWLDSAEDVEVVGWYDVASWRARLRTDAAAQAALVRWGIDASEAPPARPARPVVPRVRNGQLKPLVAY